MATRPETKKLQVSMDAIGEDLLHNILSRLPARTFASAACVSGLWNRTCSRVLSSPKLSSAISLKPYLLDAVNEVVEKVLIEPIRPHFAIASVGPGFSFLEAHLLISGKFGSKIPVITCLAEGIIGKDALTDEFKEVQWKITVSDDSGHEGNSLPSVNRGILLTVGFLPGLRSRIIALSAENEDPNSLMIDEFVTEIRQYSSSVSSSPSPAAVILFSDQENDMRPVLERMDYAFAPETAIVGDASGQFLFNDNCSRCPMRRQDNSSAAVALVFARDRDMPHDMGETQFHTMISTGISPVGQSYRAVSVRGNNNGCSTWFTARRESFHESLDGQTILDHIYDEIGERVQYPALYVGVLKRRKYSIGSEKAKWVASQAFHEVLDGDEEYLFVNGRGIKTGDPFRFYLSNPSAALSSCNSVSMSLRQLKEDSEDRNSRRKSVIGGIIFSCCGRGERLFGHPRVDSLPFLENFPGVDFAGTFCSGEIGRGDLSLYQEASEENNHSHIRCCMHVFSSVYLVMSYTPRVPQE